MLIPLSINLKNVMELWIVRMTGANLETMRTTSSVLPETVGFQLSISLINCGLRGNGIEFFMIRLNFTF